MATTKEGTLQINRFGGIDRTEDGTVNDPSLFYTMQNMYPLESGKLSNLGGVTKLNASALAGISEFVHVAPYVSSQGASGILGLYRFTDTIPNPSGMVFTTQGAATATHNVITSFVGPGARTANTTTNAVQFGASGVQVTLPTNVPDYVSCVHFYGEIVSGGVTGGYIWMGSLCRRGGTFPASIILFEPTASGNSTNTQYSATPTEARVQTYNDASGKLLGGRRYYFGIAPWIGVGGTVVRFADTSNKFFVVDMPEGHNAFKVRFISLPATAGNNVASAYTHSVLFLGTEAGDMLPVCDFTDGRIRTIPNSSLTTVYGFTVLELPYNSNLHPSYTQLSRDTVFGKWNYTVEAIAGKYQGYFMLCSSTPYGAPYFSGAGLGLVMFPSNYVYGLTETISDSNRIEIYPNPTMWNWTIQSSGLTTLSASPRELPSFFEDSGTVNHALFQNRTFFVNGYNVPFYTNGQCLKPITKANGVASPPVICKNVSAVGNRLVFGGGPSNIFYTEGYIVASASADFMTYSGGSAVQLLTLSPDSGDIIGLGRYSQDLSVDGAISYLVIGKERSILVANLDSSTPYVREISRESGFASDKCFVNTTMGPIFVGRDNVYRMISANQVEPIGFQVDSIIKAMSKSTLATVKALWHEDNVKIGWVDADETDTELWLQLKRNPGGVSLKYSGLHYMKPYVSMAVIPRFGELINYRVSIYGADLYSRDSSSSASNVGTAQDRVLVISRLGMGRDHFRKVMTRLYLALIMEVDETFDITLDFEDGSAQYTTSSTALIANGPRQFLETLLDERPMGRVVKVTVENSSENLLSILDVSLLFNTKRRRRMT